MNEHANSWLNIYNPKTNYDHQLICFPHAGGSASFFRNWGLKMENCQLYSVQYPGRAERFDEPCEENLKLLSKQISKAIYSLKNDSIVLFGHSMGAVVALETARELEKMGIKITHLFASGSRNGPCPPLQTYIEEDDQMLCKQLVEMGGTKQEAIEDPIFCELVLPSIRADGKMFHAYEMNAEPLLQCPVTTIFGAEDEHADIRPWQDLAPFGFIEYCVSGDHFYLISEPPFSIINNSLNTHKRTSQHE